MTLLFGTVVTEMAVARRCGSRASRGGLRAHAQ